MLTPDLLHDYQKKAVNFQCSLPNSMLWLDMGLGKTVITLTSIAHLINSGFLRGVVIVAPIRVIRLVWRQEALKWTHSAHLKFSMVVGTKDQRTRALLRPADIYIVNYENLGWLSETLHTYFIKKGRPIPFNGIVWDEISKMKNSATNRVKAFRKIADHFDWATGLTGTPASNGYKDLHGQFLVVDKGERLGTSKTSFRTRFYRKVGPFKELPYNDTEDTIKKLIGDITLEMSAEDYNPLPDLIVNDIELDMPDDLRLRYDQLEKEFFMVLDSGKEVEVFNQAAVTNKCLQFSNGAIYPVAGMPLWESVHDIKLDALEDIIDEVQGNPVLCAYAYRSDAERIMTKFKSLRPINLTQCKSEASLIGAMRRWETGDCQLMIGHPACLHPRTQVLTELRGWVRIVDVLATDRVFDGVEFVNHDGCSYSGFKYVIDVFGITMTPDHKLLINGNWMEAESVRDCGDIRAAALYQYQGNDKYLGEMLALRDSIKDLETECNQAQPIGSGVLPVVRPGQVPQSDRYTNLENMARDEVESAQSFRQQLQRSWDHYVPGMGKIRVLLRGYGTRIFGRFDDRTNRRKRRVFQRELPMGDQHGTAIQQAQQQVCYVPREADPSCRIVQTVGFQQDDDYDATQSRNVGRRCDTGLQGLHLWKGYKSEEKSHVYDLVNCGPRHQFVIRNDAGEVFISHNSMGHGIDGLQKNGHTLVWFGLNWSLDLYDQFNARVRRQGQGVPVICHRITMRNTLDQVQTAALDSKASTQAGLRNAVKQYRQMRGV